MGESAWRAAGCADIVAPELAAEQSWFATVSISFENPNLAALQGSTTFEVSGTAEGDFAYTLLVADANASELGSISTGQGQPPRLLTLPEFAGCSGVAECVVDYVIEVRATAGSPKPTLSITSEAVAESVLTTEGPTLMVIAVEEVVEPGDTGEDTGEDTGDTAEE